MFIQWSTVILAALVLFKPLCGGAVCNSWDHDHHHHHGHDHGHCHEAEVCEHGALAAECDEQDCQHHQHDHEQSFEHERSFFAAPDQLNVPAASGELIAEIEHWFAEPARFGSADRQTAYTNGFRAPPPLRATLCVYLT